MSLGSLLWLLSIVIAVLVGIAKYAAIVVPVVTPLLMQDPAQSLFIALALALISKLL